MTFENAEILQQDGDLIDTCWLYDEIYLVDGGYELHILLTGRVNFTLRFSGLLLEYSEDPMVSG